MITPLLIFLTYRGDSCVWPPEIMAEYSSLKAFFFLTWIWPQKLSQHSACGIHNPWSELVHGLIPVAISCSFPKPLLRAHLFICTHILIKFTYFTGFRAINCFMNVIPSILFSIKGATLAHQGEEFSLQLQGMVK